MYTYVNFFIENSSCICFSPCDDNFTKNYIGIGQAAILGFKFFLDPKNSIFVLMMMIADSALNLNMS